MLFPAFFACALLCSYVFASGISILPTKTKPGDHNGGLQTWSSKPTEQTRPDLLRRQNQQTQSPDFCGYVNGNGSYPLTCANSGACVAFTEDQQFYGCCQSTSVIDPGVSTLFNMCNQYLACIDSTVACDAACQRSISRTDLLHCTGESAPACIQITFPNTAGLSLSNFACQAQSVATEPTPLVSMYLTSRESTSSVIFTNSQATQTQSSIFPSSITTGMSSMTTESPSGNSANRSAGVSAVALLVATAILVAQLLRRYR